MHVDILFCTHTGAASTWLWCRGCRVAPTAQSVPSVLLGVHQVGACHSPTFTFLRNPTAVSGGCTFTFPTVHKGLHVSTLLSTHKPGFHVSVKGLGASRSFSSGRSLASAEPPGPRQLLTGSSPPGAPREPPAAPCADTASRRCRRSLMTSPAARSARAQPRVAEATAQVCRPRSGCSRRSAVPTPPAGRSRSAMTLRGPGRASRTREMEEKEQLRRQIRLLQGGSAPAGPGVRSLFSPSPLAGLSGVVDLARALSTLGTAASVRDRPGPVSGGSRAGRGQRAFRAGAAGRSG